MKNGPASWTGSQQESDGIRNGQACVPTTRPKATLEIESITNHSFARDETNHELTWPFSPQVEQTMVAGGAYDEHRCLESLNVSTSISGVDNSN